MLAAWWEATWVEAGLSPPPAPVRETVLGRYREPWRAYHTVQHLQDCAHQAARFGLSCPHPGAVQLALWYHDVVYDPQAHDNEARSAALAADHLRAAGAAPDLVARVERLILATRHQAEPGDADEALLVDIDLSILGAPPDRFATFETQVRQEYAFVPDAAFAAGRAAVLRSFLDRPHIYATAPFRQALEAQARANLEQAVARWSGQVAPPEGPSGGVGSGGGAVGPSGGAGPSGS